MSATFVPLNVKNSPPLAFFACAQINNKVYAHGGTTSRPSALPTNELWTLDLETLTWMLESKQGPQLAHHAATEHEGLLQIVGGFNGKQRVSNVWLFDQRCGQWSEAKTVGFPRGAGLSGHTVTRLSQDQGTIVIGRLGGIRTQRKSSSVLKLSKTGEASFSYSDLPHETASRSGHTATTLSSSKLLLAGGRDENGHMDFQILATQDRLALEHHRSSAIAQTLTNSDNRHPFRPTSRKQHAAVAIDTETVLFHGGESFNALDKCPLNDVFCWKRGTTFQLKPQGTPSLCGHVILRINRKFVAFGGLEKQFKPSLNFYEIL